MALSYDRYLPRAHDRSSCHHSGLVIDTDDTPVTDRADASNDVAAADQAVAVVPAVSNDRQWPQ